MVLGLDGTSQLSGLTPDMVGEIAQVGLTGTYEHYRDNLDTNTNCKHNPSSTAGQNQIHTVSTNYNTARGPNPTHKRWYVPWPAMLELTPAT